MMNIAECLDNEQFHNATEFQPSTVKPHLHSESFPQPMDLDAMIGSTKAKQNQLDLKNRTYFKCHTPGHQSRQCPQNSQSGNAESH
ncbi:hypothetical protein BGX23_005178 [Mortierella sp. AD031]|nr:hypothetical protein BGX23_005178 [Mortierella sp. AD031]